MKIHLTFLFDCVMEIVSRSLQFDYKKIVFKNNLPSKALPYTQLSCSNTMNVFKLFTVAALENWLIFAQSQRLVTQCVRV